MPSAARLPLQLYLSANTHGMATSNTAKQPASWHRHRLTVLQAPRSSDAELRWQTCAVLQQLSLVWQAPSSGEHLFQGVASGTGVDVDGGSNRRSQSWALRRHCTESQLPCQQFGTARPAGRKEVPINTAPGPQRQVTSSAGRTRMNGCRAAPSHAGIHAIGAGLA